MFRFASHWRLVVVLAVLALLAGPRSAAFAVIGEGSDLEIGGPGQGNGKFFQIVDLAFDAQNRLYVLDGVRWEKNTLTGNGLVQVFDADGKFLRQFSVVDPTLKDRNAPAHLAIDGRGNVYVTQPRAGLVQQFGADGKVRRTFAIANATAIAVRKVAGREHVLVVPNKTRNNQPVAVRAIEVIDAEDGSRSTLALGQPIRNCHVLKTDAAGNLYAQGGVNQVYKFAADGAFRAILGGGTTFRTADGSELLATLALDSKGNLYGNTFGNPSNIARFNPDFTTVTQREGQFAWADAWGEGSILAIDRHDRLWVGTPGNTPGNDRYHYRPCVLRTEAGFLDATKPNVATHSTLLLGLNLAVENALPYGIQYDLEPASFALVVKASNRRVQHLDVDWVVHDIDRVAVARGQFALPLEDGVEARKAVSFTPPRFGWYTISFMTADGGKPLMGVGRHLGVTPRFVGMPALAAGESTGGWEDAPRQAFAGLMLQRVHTNQGLDKLEHAVAQAEKYGLTLLVQFENKKACDPAHVQAAVARFKGRVKYWEIMNEPNFFMSPAEYVKMVKELYPLIKGIDPQAQVVGPDVCGIQLPWYEAFYKLGGKECIDILSIHDYEGNEAIDPGHWAWKLGALRTIMARYGDADRPIWQTERAIGGVRAANFEPGVQAVRMLLHRDLLETLGIPSAHNLHYYLNQGGYGSVPTYIWSDAGPHPAALATRTREALIRGRRYAGTLDFGPTGNKLYMGLRHEGGDGQTITLRNLGTLPQDLELGIASTTTSALAVEVVDAFGNRRKEPVKHGKLSVRVTPMPVYLRLAQGQTVTPPRIDFGRNVAGQASFTYSAESTGPLSILTNGILEAPHPGDPHPNPWMGKLPSLPQSLEMRFPYPRTIDRAIVYTVRADNPYCTLLDYDLEVHDGNGWVTLDRVRAPVPASDLVNTPQCKANTWYQDENFYVHRFAPVTTGRLRLVVRRTTRGFMPDDAAVQAAGWSANAPHLMLREIEVYGPVPPIELELTAGARTLNELAAIQPIKLALMNHTDQAKQGRVRIDVPTGWKATPAELPFMLAAGASARHAVELMPPPGAVPVGPLPVTAVLVDDAGKVAGFDRLTLDLAAPVAVALRSPDKVESRQQAVPVHLKNVTQGPIRGVVKVEALALGDTGKPLTAEVPFGPIEAGRDGMVSIPLPGMDLTASGWRLSCTVTAQGLRFTTEQDWTQVRPWQVLGPFPNLTGRAFDVDFGPEKGIDLKQTFAGAGGKTIAWQSARNAPTGYLDFASRFQPNILVCAYAVTYVKSPAARQALLSAGSDDGGKVWVNGQLVISKPGARSAAAGQDKVEVTLRAGWNEVLFKVPQSHGGWGLYFDLLTPAGGPMPDLRYAADRSE